ncbi:MAG: hypothetical protein QM796_00910 [Chthoniobacteraceae bacterium]
MRNHVVGKQYSRQIEIGNNYCFSRKGMNAQKLLLTLLCASAMAGAWLFPISSTAQADLSDSQLSAALLEVQAQQKLISDNQTAIDTKLAAVQEQIRVARIYVSRSGGKK